MTDTPLWQPPYTAQMITPTFDGATDPLPWISRMQLLFRLYNTPTEVQVDFAALHLTYIACAWFLKISSAKASTDWELFTWILRREFGHLRAPSYADWPRKTGSVNDYINSFSDYELHSTNLSEFEKIHIFLSRLSPALRHLLDSSSLASLTVDKGLAKELTHHQDRPPWQTKVETVASLTSPLSAGDI